MRALFFLMLLSLLPMSAMAADTPLGQPLTLTETTAISTVLATPEQYVGQTVQIRGLVVDVCSKRGCWMALASDKGYDQIRVKVRDGVIVFPMEARGNEATVEGQLEKLELSREQMISWARHQAEEKGQPFDPSSVTSGKTIYQIRAQGAVLHR